MTAGILKHTKSISPLTLKTIDAKIVFDGENICRVKKDEEGREYKTLKKIRNCICFLRD